MITIATKELRRFTALASHIKDTHIIPAYGYVKIEVKDGKCTLYKSNGHSFIIFPVESNTTVDETVLIEEVILYGYIGTTSKDEIKISVDDNRGLLDNGSRPAKFQSLDPSHFPAIQQKEDSKSFTIDVNVISALHQCKQHTLTPIDKAIRPWNTFVHLSKVDDKFGVGGFNGTTAHFELFNSKLPLMVFDTDTISAISKFESVEYSTSGNYDLFEYNGVVYGFIKPEVTPRDLTTLYNNLSKGTHIFTVKRTALIEFCDSVIKMNNTNVPPTITISSKGKSSILLEHIGFSELDLQEEISVKKLTKFETHTFDPKYLILLLKDLQYDEVEVCLLNEGFVFKATEEPNYLGVIMKMQNQN